MNVNNSTNFVTPEGYLKYLPLFSVAVKKDSCEPDPELALIRVIHTIAISYFSIIGIAILLTGFSAKLWIAGTIVMISITLLDAWRSERAANARAVNEFATLKIPSRSAMSRIQHNLGAAKLLIQNAPAAINKSGVNGTLLSYTPNLEVFKLLVDNGGDVKLSDHQYQEKYFFQLLLNDKISHLEHVLTKNHVVPNDFSNDEQVEMWRKVRSDKAGQLLLNSGFDINVKDKNGRTALEYTVYLNRGMHQDGELIRVLLNCGADTTKAINIHPCALDTKMDESVKAILEAK